MWKLTRAIRPEAVLICGTVVFMGGVSALLNAAYDGPTELVGMVGLLLAICGALMAASALNFFSRRQAIKGELEKFHMGLIRTGEQNILGLVEIGNDSTIFDYADMIASPKRLLIVLNHGQTWVSIHKDRLKRRLADPYKETVFFLTHPESPVVALLARKNGTEPEYIVGKIRETIRIIEDITAPASSVSVYGHFLFNTYSACVGDKEALLTPYFISRGSRTVPVFRYSDVGPDCLFRSLVEDLDRLKLDCRFIDKDGSDISNVVQLSKPTG